jgi:3-dehydroquinate synthase
VAFAVPFTYPVVFANGVFAPENDTLSSIFPDLPNRRHRLLFVLDGGVAEAQPDLISRINEYVGSFPTRLEMAGPVLIVPGGELAKNDPEVLLGLQRQLADLHLDRHSFCVAVGGGAVLDVVGFAAATVHRGVRLIRLPTTVLGQNDAGVGVKNGVNAFGQKNFLGSFAPPFAVINDSALLRTLPARELRAGMSEAVKVALIRDAQFFEWLCQYAGDIAAFDDLALAHLVQRGAELHMDHIEGGGDPFERGSARPLDFGHWSAHKLERLTNHEVRHGEAVAIGIALDSLYSAAKGWLSEVDAARIIDLLLALGLPVTHPALYWTSAAGKWLIEEGFEEFREHLGGELSVTFLRGIGRGETHHVVDLDVMRRCAAQLRTLSSEKGEPSPDQSREVRDFGGSVRGPTLTRSELP